MRTLASALIGFASGIASGAFGIGGALMSTPGVRWVLHVRPLIAVGTTLPVIVPTAVTGVVTYARSGLLEWRTAGTMAIAGSAFSVLGALTTKVVPGEVLLVVTAALLLFLSVRMIRHSDAPGAETVSPSIPILLVVGSVSGFVSGLLGVGGGVILVPVLTVLLGFPVKKALGTSLAVVAAQAIPGTITHALIGNVDWRIAGGLALGVIPGARIGSLAAVAAEDAKLRVVVAVALGTLALVFGATELHGLAS